MTSWQWLGHLIVIAGGLALVASGLVALSRRDRSRARRPMQTPEDGGKAVEPRFVLRTALVALAIYTLFGPETFGPWAVILGFGCWRLSVSDSKSVAWVGQKLLAALLLFGVAFWLGASGVLW
jgi:hypothetical protein